PHREPDAHARHRSHEAGRGVAADRGARRSLDPGALRLLSPLAHRRRPDLGRARDDAPRRRRLPAGRAPDHAAHDRVPELSGPRSCRMTNGSVLFTRHDGIVTLTLNRPETLNAMNEAMMGEIERILIELEADTAVRAVVLTGAGRAFSSGGDQKRSGDSPTSFFEGVLGGALIERLNRCILRMQRLRKPIIGSINGVAAGAGMNIALATDLRIASDTARFGEVFARVGLVPDGGGTYFLPRLVGTAKAMEMILLADIIDAQEALRIGLVNRVVPAEQLQQETLKLAERLAQGPTVAYGLAKTGLYQ